VVAEAGATTGYAAAGADVYGDVLGSVNVTACACVCGSADSAVCQAPYSLGSVTPVCPWYFPFFMAYVVSGTSSPWKNSSWASPSLE